MVSQWNLQFGLEMGTACGRITHSSWMFPRNVWSLFSKPGLFKWTMDTLEWVTVKPQSFATSEFPDLSMIGSHWHGVPLPASPQSFTETLHERWQLVDAPLSVTSTPIRILEIELLCPCLAGFSHVLSHIFARSQNPSSNCGPDFVGDDHWGGYTVYFAHLYTNYPVFFLKTTIPSKNQERLLCLSLSHIDRRDTTEIFAGSRDILDPEHPWHFVALGRRRKPLSRSWWNQQLGRVKSRMIFEQVFGKMLLERLPTWGLQMWSLISIFPRT